MRWGVIPDGSRGRSPFHSFILGLWLDTGKVALNATHTQTAPEVRVKRSGVGGKFGDFDLGVMDPADYVEFAAKRIAGAVRKAWSGRAPGGISWGLGQAVVGHNRRGAGFDGASHMYGNAGDPTFSHIEGYEDHGVNLLFTWAPDARLTGVVVNLVGPEGGRELAERIVAILKSLWAG